MSGQTKILLVDDHQLIIEGIISYLKDIDNLEIETANSCDEAFSRIKTTLHSNPFHIVFTDLSFDNNNGNVILDGGEALIKAIKNEGINIKTGVITGHSETNRVFNVIHNLNPSAYILKGNCSTDELTFAIQKMLKDEIYYTHEIHQKLLKRALVEIQMDDVAIQILKELPNHAKIANLEGVVKKTDGSLVKVRSIESKLAKLRTDLQAHNNTDLVLKAKELGIVD
ncbi:response regulator transcription factor [Tenacibaculum sp. AHE15PA]|uniref:response regulator transcription factor n=1 Tax=unclassified Tenacibaculum TaxID=2635139 RepID=UPI001C4F85E3|nr:MULTISPECIES: response regulator [unclassified Tenacibaculum]QXP73085.1 response regulator transcription factor [Tenacibaculum sp. AHE14PA]QXP76999.1 response regulator transcription factor [Tenacibaculum sp. AHE15PA]